MRAILLMLGCLVVMGCALNRSALQPSEQDEQEARMREFLDETSPRKMNQLPKVTPEFKKTFRSATKKKIVEEEVSLPE